jgi:hypothetical protein
MHFVSLNFAMCSDEKSCGVNHKGRWASYKMPSSSVEDLDQYRNNEKAQWFPRTEIDPWEIEIALSLDGY